jgi:hypothetical protein
MSDNGRVEASGVMSGGYDLVEYYLIWNLRGIHPSTGLSAMTVRVRRSDPGNR